MKVFTTVAAALAAFQTVSAHTIPTTTTATCATPTATTTKIEQHLHCRRFVCIDPTRTCSAGEPTGLEPRPPYVFSTVTPAPGACTAVAEAIDNPGCDLCPTCLAAPVVRRTEVTPLPMPAFTASI